MFVVSPAAILYDANGNPIAVSPDVAIPAGTSTILIAGTDGTNARLFSVDASGRLAVQNPPNLDVALSTLATQATVATLLTEAEFEARVNTLGQKTAANSTPVVLASDQSAIPVTDDGGSLTVDNANLDVALSTLATQATVATLLTEAEFESRIGEVQANPTANTVLGRLKDIEDEVAARLGVLGQTAMVGSTPVVIASDQSDVGVAQGTAAVLAGAWPVKVTDGTNTLPTGDAAARSVFTQISDGTNGPAAVKAASAAAQATDPSLVMAFSPNSPLPSGSNEVGAFAQGTPAALSDYWPVGVTDGANSLPTMDVASRSGYVRITDGTNTQPTGDIAARSIFMQLSDGTHGPAAIKPASTQAVVADSSLVVQITPNQPPIPTTVVPATSIAGSVVGRIAGVSSGTFTTVRQTTYVEQTTNAQRSIVSANANDSAAGTGARQVQITYLSATGEGPFTETVTLNGTTAVNTVATNICFIERMDVVAVGSGGSNAGAINLYTGTGATGVIFAAIGTGAVATGTGDNQTFYAHHYVPIDFTVQGYYVSVGIIASAGGGSSVTVLRYRDPTIPTSPWRLASDYINAAQGNSTSRTYFASIKLPGPLVVAAFVTPANNNSTATCSFDFADAPI